MKVNSSRCLLHQYVEWMPLSSVCDVLRSGRVLFQIGFTVLFVCHIDQGKCGGGGGGGANEMHRHNDTRWFLCTQDSYAWRQCRLPVSQNKVHVIFWFNIAAKTSAAPSNGPNTSDSVAAPIVPPLICRYSICMSNKPWRDVAWMSKALPEPLMVFNASDSIDFRFRLKKIVLRLNQVNARRFVDMVIVTQTMCWLRSTNLPPTTEQRQCSRIG